jgi:hypothetical protein
MGGDSYCFAIGWWAVRRRQSSIILLTTSRLTAYC